MENTRTAFAIKLIFGFPIAGIVWTFLIYYFSSAEIPNFKIAYWICGVGVALGVLSILSRYAYSIIFKFWNLLIHLIDVGITWFTMTIFFYFLFTPFAFAIRFFGKATMKKTTSRSPTLWKSVRQPSSLKQYLRQF